MKPTLQHVVITLPLPGLSQFIRKARWFVENGNAAPVGPLDAQIRLTCMVVCPGGKDCTGIVGFVLMPCFYLLPNCVVGFFQKQTNKKNLSCTFKFKLT
ncbi:unnamed protein product [Urochloa humidicola]